MLEYIKKKVESKKIFAIGNPPYQENDGGGNGKSSRPIYNIFIRAVLSQKNIEQSILVVPARWFKGGKGLNNFREKMMKSKMIKYVRYFENSHSVFPKVDIRGGVCFLHCSQDINKKAQIESQGRIESVNLSKYDIIIPNALERSIARKVLDKSDQFFVDVVWPRNSFGVDEKSCRNTKFSKSKKTVICVCANRKKIVISAKKNLKNEDKINEYKVAFPKASGGGKGRRHKILPKPNHFFVLNRGEISSETYSIASSFKKIKKAKGLMSFLQTYFSRFLFGLRKPTHNASKDTFAWIPLMDTDIQWTDEMLFEHFGITKKEQKYIKEKVNYWTV